MLKFVSDFCHRKDVFGLTGFCENCTFWINMFLRKLNVLRQHRRRRARPWMSIFLFSLLVWPSFLLIGCLTVEQSSKFQESNFESRLIVFCRLQTSWAETGSNIFHQNKKKIGAATFRSMTFWQSNIFASGLTEQNKPFLSAFIILNEN